VYIKASPFILTAAKINYLSSKSSYETVFKIYEFYLNVYKTISLLFFASLEAFFISYSLSLKNYINNFLEFIFLDF